MGTEWRCENVGSLLRPEALLAAREQYAEGTLDAPAFKRIEDRAVRGAVTLQEDVGLDVISDGELRRASWTSHFYDSLEGFEAGGGVALPWRDSHGATAPDGGNVGRRAVVVDKLRWKHSMCGEEWTFLRGETERPTKVTIASAEMAAAVYDEEKSKGAYPTREAYFSDVIDLLRHEVTELVRLGCTYIQLDSPQYGALIDPQNREFFRRRGSDPDKMIDAGIEMDNAVIVGFPGVVFGLHICRGNNQSQFYAEGGYDSVTRIFERGRFDRFLLEYDDARSGGFEPLRTVPEDRTVVLGLVSSKHADLESEADLMARVEEASGYVPLDRLALSPQCGFASVMAGNRITPDDQRAKLELTTRLARKIWG